MQVQVSKASEELSTVDRLAKILYATFNKDQFSNSMVEGIFTLPYSEDRAYSQEEYANLTFHYDKIEQIHDNRTVASKFIWRDWGFRAQEILARLGKESLSIIELKQVENKPFEIGE